MDQYEYLQFFCGGCCIFSVLFFITMSLLAIFIGRLRAEAGLPLPRKRTGYASMIRDVQSRHRWRLLKRREQRREQLAERRHQELLHAIRISGAVSQLTPTEFEVFVGTLFENFGCTVEHTGKGGDGGIDLRVRGPNGKPGLVQCKQYAPDHPVGAPTVRNLRGAMAREGIDLGFLVTTSTFTQPAREEAEGSGIYLFDAEKLNNLREKFGA
jgi:restriction endonuclease Mrr